ncbi:MAG TPA: ATP synthase F1 subunit gamma [Fusibacter sp.]|jgi:F-type H+-transporting ATPase subunit gamma|nr:ATP synthase F1 subunit gamma [Fusibacter sp.]
MASSTRDIKRKIRSVNSTMQITKAFELVSTAKLKRARDRMDITKPYFDTIQTAVHDILSSDKSIKSKFVTSDVSKNPLYIVVTSDRGLCGGYNINAIKKALETARTYDNPKFIAVGKKSFDLLNQMGYNIIDSFLYISEKPEFSHASQVARAAMTLLETGEVDSIHFVYTRFISTMTQTATDLLLLPIERPVLSEDTKTEIVNYEPSAEEVLRYIIPKYVESTIFGGLIESSASEQAARRLAMESASDNAEEIIEDLTLYYNRARQAAITQEISEIVGGAEALK